MNIIKSIADVSFPKFVPSDVKFSNFKPIVYLVGIIAVAILMGTFMYRYYRDSKNSSWEPGRSIQTDLKQTQTDVSEAVRRRLEKNPKVKLIEDEGFVEQILIGDKTTSDK